MADSAQIKVVIPGSLSRFLDAFTRLIEPSDRYPNLYRPEGQPSEGPMNTGRGSECGPREECKREEESHGFSPEAITLARVLHESGREAVEKRKVVNDLGKPFLSWDEISEDAREGRMMMANYLLNSPELAITFPLFPKRSDRDQSGGSSAP